MSPKSELESPVITVAEESFEREVVARSHDIPVVVDFWASWCAPCRTLGPVLERLAREAGGAWLLAKVDVDANPRLAAAAGVQGIPAVRAFVEGRQVAEFTGALPEPHVRRWLEQFTPSAADDLVDEAGIAESEGRLEDAAASYKSALDTAPGHAGARAGAARVNARLRAAQAQPNGTALAASLARADVDFVEGRPEVAFDALLRLVRSHAGDEREQARARIVELLDALPPEDPLAARTRKALGQALF